MMKESEFPVLIAAGSLVVQDIRKRFLNHIAANHVQTERVNLVFQAQQDVAAGCKTGEPAYIPQKRPPRS